MIALLVIAAALSQDYSFATTAEHYGYFYPTAYYDHDGADWNCGDFQYSGHRGNDFGVGSWSGMDAGRDLVAAADGTVLVAHDGEYDRCSTGDCDGGGGFGNYVKLQHADGKVTYYGHMRQWSVAVAEGQYVPCGTHLGQVGSSGYSTGPHLHFEVRNAEGSQGDPFDGDCSFPPSWWVVQGAYMGLPGRACESSGPCTAAGVLACGDALDGRNDGAGATDEHAYYGCSEFSYTGPEVVWTFSTPRDEPVTLALTGLAADLDLYVLGSLACDASDCVTASSNPHGEDEGVTFDAAAGEEYAVVVDGWEDAVSGFHLAVACQGGEDSGPDDTEGPTDSPGPDDSEASGPWPPGDRQRLEPSEPGCGCGAVPRISGGAWWLAPLGLALRRRRRAG